MQFVLLICAFPGLLIRWIFLRRKYSFQELSKQKLANGSIGYLFAFIICGIYISIITTRKSHIDENKWMIHKNIGGISSKCDSAALIYDAAILELSNNKMDSSAVRIKYESIAKSLFRQTNELLNDVNIRKKGGQFSRAEMVEYDKKLEHLCDSVQRKMKTLKNLGMEFDLE